MANLKNKEFKSLISVSKVKQFEFWEPRSEQCRPEERSQPANRFELRKLWKPTDNFMISTIRWNYQKLFDIKIFIIWSLSGHSIRATRRSRGAVSLWARGRRYWKKCCEKRLACSQLDCLWNDLFGDISFWWMSTLVGTSGSSVSTL